MREKLIKFLVKAEMAADKNGFYNCNPNIEKAKFIADHLIANGVTIQKWIPVAERLPETTCRNLVTKYGIPFLAYYTGKEWRESGTLSVVDGITHWIPLPEPPKEDV